MSTNSYLEWPLWHYFTLHMQNLRPMTDSVRATSLGREHKSLLNLASSQDDMHRAVYESIMKSKFYDFINDEIVDGDKLSVDTVVMMASASTSITLSDPTTMVILKGTSSTISGGRIVKGEFMPTIGTLANQRIIQEALAAAIKISTGELISKVNVLERISEEDRQHVTAKLQGITYENPTVQSILRSYRMVSTGISDTEKSLTKIRNALTKVIGPDQAINVSTGQSVGATGGKYNVVEYTVRIPGATPESGMEKTVKFAFRLAMKEDERRTYERLLVERFQARPAQAGVPSESRRVAITLAPIVAESTEAYRSLFPEASQSIIPYLNTLRSNVIAINPAHGQTLHEQEMAERELEEEENIDEL